MNLVQRDAIEGRVLGEKVATSTKALATSWRF
jgi:hypothetical protein